MFSYHDLEHRAEDLGVLRHAAYVELPGEDGRVVILILQLNKDLGRVSCKKTNGTGLECTQVQWRSFTLDMNTDLACIWSKITSMWNKGSYSILLQSVHFNVPSQASDNPDGLHPPKIRIGTHTNPQRLYHHISIVIRTDIDQMLHNLAPKLLCQYDFFTAINSSKTSKENLESFPRASFKLFITESISLQSFC